MPTESVDIRAARVVSRYLEAGGNQLSTAITSKTKLMTDVGLTSDDGVNVVLDLCSEFGINLPDDFNAVVHDNGLRERTFGELVTHMSSFINSKERAT
jgi:acyl carrier protein